MLSRGAVRAALRAQAVALARPTAQSSRGLQTTWVRGMAKDSRFARSSPPRPQDPRVGRSIQTPTPQNSAPSSPDDSRVADQSRNRPANQPGRPRPLDAKLDTWAAEQAAEKHVAPGDDKPSSSPAGPDEGDPQIPDLSKLPDLTQGIPSTLEYEATGKAGRSALTAYEAEPSSGAGGRGKGELPASAYISSSERRRQKLLSYMFATLGVSVVGVTIYMGRDWDEEDLRRHPGVPNGWGLGLWWKRAMTRLSETMSYYSEPAFEKLLPDPDPSFERPYTLCISLEDMLVHSEWTREQGWRVAKRPGVDYFLRYLSQYYELALFTTVPFGIGEPIMHKLDPFRFVMWPLYREATRYKDGEIVKDLSYLNRDLSKVIIIDTNAKHVRAQPENAIVLPKWTGDPKDTDLVALIPFLEYIHTMQYGDVRKVLKSFEGKHIPTEFARREAIARAEFNKQVGAQPGKNQASKKAKHGGMGMLSSMLGLEPSHMSLMVAAEGEENPTEAFAKGKMLQDIARERGQRQYQMLEKEIRENGEKWLKEDADLQEKAQKEAIQSWKGSFLGMFGAGKDETVQADSSSPSSNPKP